MSDLHEIRAASAPFSVREDGDGGTWLEGYASTFNQPYDMGWYRETVAPGAFSRTLGRSPDVRLLINHDGLPLARTSSGTLQLEQDSIGLRVRARLDASDPDVSRLLPKMGRGDLGEMSFAFRIDGREGQAWNGDMTERTLKSLDLNNGDVSIVTYPANPHTSAALSMRGGRPSMEAIASVLMELERRAATPETMQSVLARVLGYFTSVDNIVDAAQAEIAQILDIPNPDEVQDEAEDADEPGETEVKSGPEPDEVRALIAARMNALRLVRK